MAHLFRNETEEDSNVAHISVFCFSHFDGYVFIGNPAPIVSIKNASKKEHTVVKYSTYVKLSFSASQSKNIGVLPVSV